MLNTDLLPSLLFRINQTQISLAAATLALNLRVKAVTRVSSELPMPS